MSINSDTILRIPLTQGAVAVLCQKLQITTSCLVKLYIDLRLDLLNDIYGINQPL